MNYRSQIEPMWINLSMLSMAGGSIKRPMTSREAYDKVCKAFYQAEDCPLSLEASEDIKAFRAESNIWEYYVGKSRPFTGFDPANITSLTTAFSTLTISNSPRQSLENGPLSASQQKEEAVAMKRKILRKQREDIQFGWNPKTGEPWFATKCSAREAFPALCGPRGVFLRELHQLTEHFVLRCVRLEDEGYTLLWPEFNYTSDINCPRLRARFNGFRAFLEEWASSTGIWSDGQRRTRIDVAYKAWITSGDFANRNVPLPEGFAFGFAFDD